MISCGLSRRSAASVSAKQLASLRVGIMTETLIQLAEAGLLRSSHFLPASSNLFRRRCPRRATLLDGDGGDQAAAGGGLVQARPGGQCAGNAGIGAIAVADDVDGARH